MSRNDYQAQCLRESQESPHPTDFFVIGGFVTHNENAVCDSARVRREASVLSATHLKWELMFYCLHCPNLNTVFSLLLLQWPKFAKMTIFPF